MRVTLGERLGLVSRPTKASPVQHSTEDVEGPVWSTGPVLRLADCPSAASVPCRTPGKYSEGCPCDYCRRRTRELSRQNEELGPRRVRGEMVWIKKDVSILKIQGRPELTPEEYSSNRRR